MHKYPRRSSSVVQQNEGIKQSRNHVQYESHQQMNGITDNLSKVIELFQSTTFQHVQACDDS